MLEPPKRTPQPLFASSETMVWRDEEYFAAYPSVRSYMSEFQEKIDVGGDFRSARFYLSHHNHSQGTYGNYRGFVERLLLWSWIFAEKSSIELSRQDFNDFLRFCKNPPSDWVGDAPRARFIGSDGLWSSNPDWRPLSDVRSHSRRRLFDGNTRQLRSVCSSFYNFLHKEGLSTANPVVAARPQQGRVFYRENPIRNVISAQHLNLIMQQLEQYAMDSQDGERALFIVAAAQYLYLRPSDLASTNEISPTMEAFRFEKGKWWLVLDARNPPLKISVGREFLHYLARYRASRGLSPLPEPEEQTPMLETVHGRSGLSSRRIKEIVRAAMAEVHRRLKCAGHSDVDLEVLKSVSLRWLRDSGAKIDARVRAPADLQHDLGSVSLTYVYGRYYAE